ncbi:MAG TPA: glycosyltransferase family 39 protein, partial [Gemmatimonadaceae bacterium]|nr:glycosyltransferase family 39 protein [Gemmatimonadaceae bacterium]
MKGVRIRQLTVVALAATVFLLPTLTYGLGFDHGFMQYVGRGMLRGLWPYVDTFDTSFPAVYLLHMMVIAIGGESVLALRVADLLIQIVTALLLYVMGHRIWGARAGFFAAVLYSIAYTAGTYYHTAQRDGYLVPFLLASMYAMWLYLNRVGDDTPTSGTDSRDTRSRRTPLVWSALAAGVGCLFRPTYALLVAIGAVCVVLRRRRTNDLVDAIIFAGVAALPMLAFFTVYAVTGHAHAISDLLTFASKVYVELERQTSSTVLLGFWAYTPIVIWLGVVLAIFHGFPGHRREAITLLVVFLGCVLIRLWESKAWRYQYWPPLAVLALSAGIGWSWLTRNRVTFALVTVLVLGLELGRSGLARYTHWHAMPEVADSPDQEAMAEYLSTHMQAGDRIQMWGPETIVLFASGHRS